MKRLPTAILIGLSIIVLSSCAFTRANLNVTYTEEQARKGPLSSIRPLNIEVGGFEDKRPETDKIGYIRNGLGMKTANIVTTEPVPQIVRDAIIAEFLKNGHLVATENKDILLSGAITSFWFETQINFFTVEFMGTVSVELNVIDGKSGAVLLTRAYKGHYHEESMGGFQGTWERVMKEALGRMVHQMSSDSKLVQVLKEYSKTAEPSARL